MLNIDGVKFNLEKREQEDSENYNCFIVTRMISFVAEHKGSNIFKLSDDYDTLLPNIISTYNEDHGNIFIGCYRSLSKAIEIVESLIKFDTTYNNDTKPEVSKSPVIIMGEDLDFDKKYKYQYVFQTNCNVRVEYTYEIRCYKL